MLHIPKKEEKEKKNRERKPKRKDILINPELLKDTFGKGNGFMACGVHNVPFPWTPWVWILQSMEFTGYEWCSDHE